MPWTETRAEERLTEWTREDGYATVRLRERADDGFVVRLDVMEQAPDGRAYERRSARSRKQARSIVDRWRDAYDAPSGADEATES